ncbi:MAG: hypothetical protein LBV04_04330 [Deferribacteraceae bacterium]|nr:hypothetical protein [Deferribacteraceae bacterium]
MNHGPLRATIDSIRTIAAKYEGKLKVEWYDVYSDEGAQFMKSKRLDGHIPLMIWINGNTTQKIDGKDTRFEGFPSGAAGPATFQGSWDMELLDKALLQATK